MIQFASKNIKFLKFTSKIPFLKHFFILKITPNFQNITDETVLTKFYTNVYVTSKTSKQTKQNRFAEIESTVLKYVKKTNNIIHDLAVSNGITSLDLFDYLKLNNIDFKLHISDKYSKIYVKQNLITRIFDAEHKFVYGYFGCLLAMDKIYYFPLTRLLFKLLQRIKSPQNYSYDLMLFHPEVLKKINQNQIYCLDYDIFETVIYDKFSFVRCMNILNLGYFETNKIISALQNIKLSLKEDGVLLVGRTIKNIENKVSFFVKKNNTFQLLEDINGGSEIKDLVLELGIKN